MKKIRWLKLGKQTFGQRYGLAILVLLTTIAFREALTPILGDRAPTLVFTVAVMIATSLGGLGPGILTMVGGFVAARYLWISPIHHFYINTPDLLIYSMIYFLVSSGIILFSLFLRASLRERIENEQRFGSLFNYNLDAVFVFDRQGRMVGANPQALRLTGYIEEELVGNTFDFLCRPDQIQAVQYSLQQALEGRPRDFECSILRKDGTSAELQFSAGPIIVDKETTGAFGVAKDITSRKHSEAVLRDVVKSVKCILSFSEVFAREGYENDSMATGYQTIRARMTVLDEEAAQHVLPLDLAQGESYAKAWLRSRHPEDAPAMRERACRALIEGKGSYSQEFRAADKFGREHWFYQLVTVEPKGPRRWLRVAVTTDITERKRAEEELRASEERFRAIFQQAAVGVAQIASASGKLVRVNQKFCEIFGYTEGEILDKSAYDLTHPEDRELDFENMRSLMAGRIPTFTTEKRCLSKAGEIVWVSLTASPLWRYRPMNEGQMGEVRPQTDYHIAVISDITERKRVGEELLRAKEDAENANISKDRFIAVMSHELRTPLNPVLMAIHAWKNEPGLPAQLVQDLEMMRHNIDIEVRLISDLLDLTALSKGKLSLQYQPVDVHELLQYALNVAHSQNTEKNLQITELLEATNSYVHSDSTRLQQVFWNLISNAVKFTPSEGSLVVSTRNESGLERHLGMDSNAGSEFIVIEIRDSGLGMDPEVVEKMFEPFEQGQAEITTRFGGLGLGLSIAKGFVELLGGTIHAQSEGRGKGSVFTVTLKTLKDPLAMDL